MPRASEKMTRRGVLQHSLAAGAAMALPWFVPARARGAAGKAAPSERITLGVIGIGPRAAYDLGGMLKQPVDRDRLAAARSRAAARRCRLGPVAGTGPLAPLQPSLRRRRVVFDCVTSRQKPAANSQVMRRSHSACHAAALAWILNRKLNFDPVKEAFIGDDEANGLRSRSARAPWVV
jgi:hypothetical protein